MSAIISAMSLACLVLKGLTTLYLEARSIRTGCTYFHIIHYPNIIILLLLLLLYYPKACTINRGDASHLELSLRNEAYQHALVLVNALAKMPLSLSLNYV